MVLLCRTAENKGKSWPNSHDMAIQEVADSWEHRDWPLVLDDLIRDISGLRRHLLESFSQCRPTAYSPSIIIELAKLLYSQPALADPADSARVAKNLQ